MIDQGNQANTGPGTPRPGTQSDTLSSEKLKQQGRESAHEVGEVVQQQAEDYYTQQRDNAAEQTQKLTGVLILPSNSGHSFKRSFGLQTPLG